MKRKTIPECAVRSFLRTDSKERDKEFCVTKQVRSRANHSSDFKIRKDVKIYEIDHIGACLCDHEYGVSLIIIGFMWKVVLKAKNRDFKFCLVGSWQFCCVLFCFGNRQIVK